MYHNYPNPARTHLSLFLSKVNRQMKSYGTNQNFRKTSINYRRFLSRDFWAQVVVISYFFRHFRIEQLQMMV